MTSRISSSSLRNITSFGEWTFGQNLEVNKRLEVGYSLKYVFYTQV
jgi:hypothetical protein